MEHESLFSIVLINKKKGETKTFVLSLFAASTCVTYASNHLNYPVDLVLSSAIGIGIKCFCTNDLLMPVCSELLYNAGTPLYSVANFLKNTVIEPLKCFLML